MLTGCQSLAEVASMPCARSPRGGLDPAGQQIGGGWGRGGRGVVWVDGCSRNMHPLFCWVFISRQQLLTLHSCQIGASLPQHPALT
jgi:hypothetical protein